MMQYACLLFIIFPLLSVDSYAAGFDCNKAISRMDKAICADKEINTTDEVMNSLYFKIRNAIDEKSRQELLTKQRSWLQQRDKKCSNLVSSCLRFAYRSRIGELLTKYDKFISLTPEEVELIAKQFPFHADWVGVYFVRNEDEGDWDIPITIDLNQIMIGDTTPRTFFWFRLKPSDDRYWFSSAAVNPSFKGLIVPRGCKYLFIQQQIEPFRVKDQTI